MIGLLLPVMMRVCVFPVMVGPYHLPDYEQGLSVCVCVHVTVCSGGALEDGCIHPGEVAGCPSHAAQCCGRPYVNGLSGGVSLPGQMRAYWQRFGN